MTSKLDPEGLRKEYEEDEGASILELARRHGMSYFRVWKALKLELTPRGWELFQQLIVAEQTVESVCERFAMQPDAVYAWRSRFLKRARSLLAEIDGAESDAAIVTSRPPMEDTP